MSYGLNQNIEFNGETYHIQIEEIEKKQALEVRVYVDGRIIFKKLHSYEEILKTSSLPQDETRKNEMLKLFYVTKAAIEKGKIKK